MSELAKSHIEIIDDSSYGAGTSAIIPFYVFATEQDKVINEETGEIAPGTTKAVANEVLMLTSRKDVTDTYGVPQFTTVNGTVQQGDELNEVGLYGLYDALGNSSLAYAIRADIDLKQLKATDAEPTGKVANQTLWFDMTNSNYGLFRANGNSNYLSAWERIDQVLVPSASDLEDGKPTSLYGEDGEIAVVSDGNSIKFYENKSTEWFLIGSEEWKEHFPTTVTGKTNGYCEVGAEIIIDGTTVTINGTSAESAAEAINAANIDKVFASTTNTMLVISKTDGNLEISQAAPAEGEQGPLETLGFDVENNTVKTDTVSMIFSSHTKVPSGRIAGSIWLKTTEPNYGSKFLIKQYVSSSDSWVSSTIPVYGSYIEAEYNYGPMLNAGSKILKYDNETAILTAYQFGSNGLKITGVRANPIIKPNDSFTIKTIIDGAIKEFTITATANEWQKNKVYIRGEYVLHDSKLYKCKVAQSTIGEFKINQQSEEKNEWVEMVDNHYLLEDLVKIINKRNINTITADITEVTDAITHESGPGIRFVSSNGNAVAFKNGEGSTILEDLGINVGESSQWVEFEFEASATEPTTDAPFGTLWFNDEMNVDIMVNDGDEWKGYHNVYKDCEIFTTSEEPLQHSDGSVLCENDIWVNTAAVDYPEIHRYYDNQWVLVDNTDQTTPLGVVFADARENAGPAYNESVHHPLSTDVEDLLVSDYVDPNCPNPQTYPKGIILFNTMLSGNNVKRFENTYENAVAELGSEFTVGNSKRFVTPGYVNNEKTTRWVTASGNATDGAGLFGRKAQRAMIVKALAEAINSNDDIRSNEYDFFYACCPGYPELDDELVKLNTEKKEMFYIVSDTPARLKAKANDITAWATNKNNASSHGEDGRIIQSAYMTRQYPSMGLTSNVDGAEITVPTSIAKMKNLLLLPRGMFAAGTQYGQVKNLASVGYINEEDEYTPVTVREGLGEVIVANKMNPIMPKRNTGLLFWGENTENAITSSLSDEHAILTLLRLKRELDEACLPFFFRPNTEALRKDFDATLRSILNDYVGREELYDYVLVTDRSVNTPERIERKELWAEIAIEIVKGVEQIYIPIRIVKTGSLSNTNA